MTPAIDDYNARKCDFSDISLEDRRTVWEAKSDLYDWCATQNAQGVETDMDDLITFFAYQDDPFGKDASLYGEAEKPDAT